MEKIDLDEPVWAAQNNWILPVNGEIVDSTNHVLFVKELALRSVFEWERTPVWESMKSFYSDMFGSMKYADLKALAVQLGILVKRSQEEQARVLSDYFNSLVGI